jgi:hypothetical protein
VGPLRPSARQSTAGNFVPACSFGSAAPVGDAAVPVVVAGAGVLVPLPGTPDDGEGALVPVPGLAGAVGEGGFVAVGATLGLGALLGATVTAGCVPVVWPEPGSGATVAVTPSVAEPRGAGAERPFSFPVSPDWLLAAGPPTGNGNEPRIGNGPSTLSRRATRPASKPPGTGTGTGTGGSGTGAGGSVGGLSVSRAAEPGAEMAILDAFAAKAGAAIQVALTKTLAAATPPRMIRRFFTTRSFPD